MKEKANIKNIEDELIEWTLMTQSLALLLPSGRSYFCLQFISKSKTSKYKYFTELILQIFEEKDAYFLLRDSY